MEDPGHQVGRRFALDDPLADLLEAGGVGHARQGVGEVPRGAGTELAGRLTAEQAPFLGSALLAPAGSLSDGSNRGDINACRIHALNAPLNSSSS